MPRLEYAERFGEFGTLLVPPSIKREFGDNVRKVAVNPFDLVYTLYSEQDLARIEALIHQRAAK